MKVAPITSPFPGEHVAATSPRLRPETDAGWRQRLNYRAGRALTADALDLEQAHRGGRLAWGGRPATSGVVRGLETGLEAPAAAGVDGPAPAGHFVHVSPGQGIAATGEDVVVPRSLRIPLAAIPVWDASPVQPDDAPADEVIDVGENRLWVKVFEPGYVPWAAVLILRPAELGTFAATDPDEPCELDPSRDAFADERRLDAARCALVVLRDTRPSNPLLAPFGIPNPADHPCWRNRLAHYLFTAEAAGAPRRSLRRRASQPAGIRWGSVPAEKSLFPWELLGVPLALFGAEMDPLTEQRRFFLDRGSVVRPGGRARPRSRPTTGLMTDESADALPPPGAGTPMLWRARVDQFAEQLASLATTDPAEQAKRFQFVPPAGLLPRAALDFLTTAQAALLPPADPDAAPDRAATSAFFPSNFAVEAVPIATEDLDAALAASAPLEPFDLAAPTDEWVRVLVPLPQSVFDPSLLAVEREDPIFAAELARLIYGRQESRQARDYVRARRDGARRLLAGPQTTAAPTALEAGQLEPEPTEALPPAGFTAVYVSPADTAGPWEISGSFKAALSNRVTYSTTLYVRLRYDPDQPPSAVTVRWRIDKNEYSHTWTAPSDAPAEKIGGDGLPQPMSLWRSFEVTTAQLKVRSGTLAGFTVRVDDGRVAVGDAGRLPAGSEIIRKVKGTVWTASDGSPVTFTGGGWTLVKGDRVAAPFEASYEPVFPDGTTLDARVGDLNAQLRLGVGAQTADIGLRQVIENTQRQLNAANDAVDLHFLTTQSNVHRIRQVLLGETDANNLLTSPALNTVINTQSARVAQEDLIKIYNAAPAATRLSAGRPETGGSSTGAAASTTPTAANRFIGLPAARLTADATIKLASPAPIAPAATSKDIYHAEPAVGQGFELRTLTIAKRFDTGPVLNAFDYADVGLRDALGLVTTLPLPYDDKDILPDVTTAVGSNNKAPVSFRQLAEGKVKVEQLRYAETVSDNDRVGLQTDTGAILAKGIRRADATTLILRRIEYYIALLSAQLQRAYEILDAENDQIKAAENRLLTLESRLAGARQEVSVARALRQEEGQRVAAINDRRDALLRDAVKFLAYVRPRALDPVRRKLPGWKLGAADAPAPVPACLQRHDQPPDALRAYVQLFRAAPARWFKDVSGGIRGLDTREKLSELLLATQRSALQFTTEQRVAFAGNVTAPALQTVLRAGFNAVAATRGAAASGPLTPTATASWDQARAQAEQHSALGDLIDGRHGQPSLARAAARLLEQIEEVATCLYAEFAAVPPGLRLAWVERYSQFDQPSPLNDLTALPRYGSLDRASRQRFQAFADWLFGRVTTRDGEAFNLINDLVRMGLLLASHAPVQNLIAGHVPRPVRVRPGALVPVRPYDPRQVRAGMEVHAWQGTTIVAQGHVEDLRDGEVSARMERVPTGSVTLDSTTRIQFVAPALGFSGS